MKKILSLIMALIMIAASLTVLADENWVCGNCGATNGPSRTECWQCGVSSSTNRSEKDPSTSAGTVNINVGDYVTFGAYMQNSASKTPIEWLVLDVQGNRALLISRYALDSQPYNTTYGNVTWETCTLRSWLNGAFYNTAFSSAEKEAIFTTTCNNDQSQGPSGCAAGGNNTQDKVFLLSNAEVNQYFLNEASRRCLPTSYAKSQGAWTAQGKLGLVNGQECVLAWWLRSPGWNQRGANIVYTDGETYLCDNDVSARGTAIRPSIWVNISAL